MYRSVFYMSFRSSFPLAFVALTPSYGDSMILPVPPEVGTVKWFETVLPSDDVPLAVTCRSLPSSEKVSVCSFGAIPVLYLLLAGFRFHVDADQVGDFGRRQNANSNPRIHSWRNRFVHACDFIDVLLADSVSQQGGL